MRDGHKKDPSSAVDTHQKIMSPIRESALRTHTRCRMKGSARFLSPRTKVMAALNISDWEDVDIQVTLDTGCCRRVMPSEADPGYEIRDSPGSL